jgi:hypothetical protein
MRGKLTQSIRMLAILAGSFVAAGSAHASFTSIGPMGAGEDNQLQIIQHQFGGSWHQVGDDFYNGSMSAKRVDDWLSVPGVLDVNNGNVGFTTDQMWTGHKFNVTAVAKFSDYSQEFGATNKNGDLKVILPSVTGYGYNITPASHTVDMGGQQFKWSRQGSSGNQSSLDSEDVDGRDHLLTYMIDGVPGTSGPVWMLFFEDLNGSVFPQGARTYADFNDLVLEVRSVASPVPLPPAGWAGLFTLGCGALVRGRKLISKALAA